MKFKTLTVRSFLLLISASLSLSIGAQPTASGDKENPASKVWVADNRDGTYKNPILHADYSDPDVVRVGEDFYMTASSFNAAPGLPVLQSKDLVNWKLVSYVFTRQPPLEVYSKPQHGNGVWAPSIRYHGGEFYIYYSDPDYGVYQVQSQKSARPLVGPSIDQASQGLDRSLSAMGRRRQRLSRQRDGGQPLRC